MPYRNMKVRMYYSKVPTEYASVPFAEFRVFVITDEKVTIPDEVFDEILDRMEFLMHSLRMAREKDTIYFIEGKEINKEIDIVEAVHDLRTTGLDRPKFGEMYRFCHIPLTKKVPYPYNEEHFRSLPFDERAFIDWKRRNIKKNVFRDDIKGLTIEEMERLKEEMETG